ncbi:hypothetical protein [Maribacter sp. 2308TA10-17]|uniref:hypothetical protein n=1 Tax=Maribacter sp. 2308TA10-17 TaxID=3386276 RepID=UPI0039BC7623
MKPLDEIRTLEEADFEILSTENKLKNLPNRVIREILLLTGLAIIFPFLPGKFGRRPMIENWDYSDALIFVVIIFVVTYIGILSWRKNRLNKRMRELKLKKHLLHKQKFK